MSFDVLIRGAVVVGAGAQRRLDVGVTDGVIAEVGPELAGPATEEIDADGLHLLPGVVDGHVHMNEPGRGDWEGFDTGTRALAAGGATAAIDMPLNAHPPTVTAAAFDEKRRAWSEAPSSTSRCGAASSRAASRRWTSSPPGASSASRRSCARAGSTTSEASTTSPCTTGCAARRPWGCPWPCMPRARRSPPVSRGVHAPPGVPRCATSSRRARPSPSSLRPREEREALWQALAGGTLPMVASDHSPAPWALKSTDDAFAAWGGISGCQTLLALLLTEGHRARGLELDLIARVTSSYVARRFRLSGKGRVEPGADADLVLVDLGGSYELAAEDLQNRHRHSPFVGRTLSAHVARTLVRGRTVFANGQIVGPPAGAC